MRKAVILGATGAVGQRFVQLLEGHPDFEVAVLAASGRSAGKTYAEACNWIVREAAMPPALAGLPVAECTPEAVRAECDVDLAFSCLPGDIAGATEEAFAKAGIPVFSKASAHRMDADVPLLVSEINPEHSVLVERQKSERGWDSFITTDPNCSTTQLVLALHPLRRLGLARVRVATMQALSGAGYPGVSSMDIMDNVVPFIKGEEEKIALEPQKIFGELRGGSVAPAGLPIDVMCHRVPVLEGHLEAVFAEFGAPVARGDVLDAWSGFKGEPLELGLPSAATPVEYVEGDARPQHRFDALRGKGMTVSTGRLRVSADGLSAQFLCLGHNTIRGAAGEGILQAEYFNVKKLF